MLTMLHEEIDFHSAEFVEENGEKVAKGVCLLGEQSSHGYSYRQQAMARAVANKLYEGTRIFINHSNGNQGRDLMHLAGVFKNTRHENGKVRGDAHLLDDDYGRKFWNVAKNMPEAAGCSHVADGKLVKGEDGKQYVEEITRVHSVDLVVQGATTKNVFEGDDVDDPPVPYGWNNTPFIKEPDDTTEPTSTRPNESESGETRERTTMSTLDEKLSELDRISDEARQLLTLDPARENVIREVAMEERNAEYEQAEERRRSDERQLAEDAQHPTLTLSTGHESDSEFSERMAAKREKERENERLVQEGAGILKVGRPAPGVMLLG